MKQIVSCAEFYDEVNDEVMLEQTGIFQHLMANFSPQLLSLQAAATRELQTEERRVRAEAESAKQDKPMGRRTD